MKGSAVILFVLAVTSPLRGSADITSALQTIVKEGKLR
jgi:hypothetical protein